MAKTGIKNTIIGLVMLSAIALSIWGISFLKDEDIMGQYDNYYAVYSKIDGLTPSSPVTINGFKVGQVRHINFHKDNSHRLVVHFTLERKLFNELIPDSTIAQISSSDLMGTKSIELIIGSGLNGYYKYGDTILASIAPSLKEQVSIQMLPVKNKAESLMLEMQEAIEIVKYIFNKKTRDDLTKSFRSIKVTMANLEKSSYGIDNLVTAETNRLKLIMSDVESITSNLKNNNEVISNILKNVNAITDSLSKSQFTKTINNVNKALVEAYEILDAVNSGEGSLAKLLNDDTVYRNIESASQNLDKLVVDFKENPKKYVRASLFDFGRTINVLTEEDRKRLRLIEKQEKKTRRKSKRKNKSKSGLVFKIQIRSAVNPIPLSSNEFKGLDGIQEIESDGMFKYLYGEANSVDELLELQGLVRSIFPDAFAIGYRNGEIISYGDAIKEMEREKE